MVERNGSDAKSFTRSKGRKKNLDKYGRSISQQLKNKKLIKMQLLKNKIIFLTGGSKGIGLECAKRYSEEGARVMIASNDGASIDEALEMLGDDHAGIICDVSEAGDVEKAIQHTLRKYGRIDIIHNNAGIAKP